MSDLSIARGLRLPLGAVTETFAILAQRRVGKTYTASVLAEELARHGVPFAVLDPTGAWWGLRSSADGEKPGIPAIVLGGQHGDVPLEEQSAKLVADLVVDEPGFYVLDLESFDSRAAQDRFAAAFLERLYRRKAKARDPMHLLVDEADSFAPQRPMPGQQAMLGAMESIVRRGGIRGLGSTLITQRPAVLNKNVLTQASCLIVLRMTGVQDVRAIDDWVALHGTPEQKRELVESLPSLERGEAWVWSPGWLGTFQRVRIRERRTFNSSATPEFGEKRVEPKRLADIDLDVLREKMAAAVERAELDDPVKLRRRIAELERKAPEVEVQERIVERVIVQRDPRFEAAAIKVAHGLAVARDLVEALEKLHEAIQAEPAEDIVEERPGPGEPFVVDRDQRVRPADVTRRAVAGVVRNGQRMAEDAVRAVVDGEGPALRAGARRMLEVLARQHPMRVTRAQLGTLTRMKHTGGTFGTYLSDLRRNGYIEQGSDGMFGATAAGFAASGIVAPMPLTKAEVVEQWRQVLREGARRMLDEVLVTPAGLSRSELAERVGMVQSGGTFGTYLSDIRKTGLVEERDGVWTATELVRP